MNNRWTLHLSSPCLCVLQITVFLQITLSSPQISHMMPQIITASLCGGQWFWCWTCCGSGAGVGFVEFLCRHFGRTPVSRRSVVVSTQGSDTSPSFLKELVEASCNASSNLADGWYDG